MDSAPAAVVAAAPAALVAPSSDLARQLASTDKQRRFQGLLVLDNLRDSAGGVPPPLAGELLPAFLACLADANDKVATAALALAPTFAATQHSELVFAAALARTADTKQVVRDAAGAAAATVLRGDAVRMDTRLRTALDTLDAARTTRTKTAVLGLLEDLVDEGRANASEPTLRDLARAAFRCCEDTNVETRVAGAALLAAMSRAGATWVNHEVNNELSNMPSNYAKTLVERFHAETTGQATPRRASRQARRSNVSVSSRSPHSASKLRAVVDEGELTRELKKIAAAFSSKGGEKSWDLRVGLLVRLRDLIPKPDAPPNMVDAFVANLRAMARDLTLQLKDARSNVLKEACLTISALATRLPDPVGDHLAELAFDQLLKNAAITVRVMSESSILCLNHLVSTVRLSSRAVSVLMDAATDKADAKRRACADIAGLLLARSDVLESERLLDLVDPQIPFGLADADAVVRARTRQTMVSYQRRCPSRAARISAALDSNTRRLIAEENTADNHLEPAVCRTPVPAFMTSAMRGTSRNPTPQTTAVRAVPQVSAARVIKPETNEQLTARRQLISDPPIRAVAAPPGRTAKRVSLQQGIRAINENAPPTRPKPVALPVLLARLQAGKTWSARVDALRVLSREFDVQRSRGASLQQQTTVPQKLPKDVDQAMLEKLLVAVTDVLSATHHRVVAEALTLIYDISLARTVPSERLAAVLEKNPVIILRVVLRMRDTREALVTGTRETLQAVKQAIGPERFVALLGRSVSFCKTAKIPESRTPGSLPCAILTLAECLRELDPEDFEWEIGFLVSILRLVLPHIAERNSCELYKASADVLRALLVATPPGVLAVLVKSMDVDERERIQKVVVFNDAEEEDVYSESSYESCNLSDENVDSTPSQPVRDESDRLDEGLSQDLLESQRGLGELNLSQVSPVSAKSEQDDALPQHSGQKDSEPYNDIHILQSIDESLKLGNMDPNSLRAFREALRRGSIPGDALDRAIETLLLCGAADGFKAELRDLALRVLTEALESYETNPDSISEILVLCCEMACTTNNPSFLKRRAQKTATVACSRLKIDVVLESALLRLEHMERPPFEIGVLSLVTGLCKRKAEERASVYDHQLDRILALLSPLTRDPRIESRKLAISLLAEIATAFPSLRTRMSSVLDFVAWSLVERYQRLDST